MNGTTTENAEQLEIPEPPAPLQAAAEPKEEGAGGHQIAEEGGEGLKSPPSAFPGHVVKRTRNKGMWGKHKGRPSNEMLAQRKAEEEAKRVAALPPGSPGRGWGGRRKNSGRHKGKTGKAKWTKTAMIRMDPEIAAKLEGMPFGKRSEYIRKALDLMTSIEPPKKELASEKEGEQSAPES